MPGETAVETPVVAEVTEEKKEIAEAEAKEAEAGEKKDEDKPESEKEAKKEKKVKEKKVKEVKPPAPQVHKKDFEKDVVYVYQYNRVPKLPSFAPYCLKLETWLKLQGIKYENVDHQGKFKSKKDGMLPFVEVNGEEIADSDMIIKSLAKTHGKDMDEGMSTDQVGINHAMTTMVDNHLHWCVVHWFNRSVDNAIKGYGINLQSFSGSKMPNGVLKFLMKHTFYRKSAAKIKAAGFSTYSDEQIDDLGKKDLKVLSELMGDKQFFFGDETRSLDLKAFVWLALLLNVDKEVDCPLRTYVEEDCKNLVGMYNRMKDLSWGDHWDEATGDKLELNPHIPKPDPPKEEEKKEEEAEKKEEDKKEEDKKEEDKEKDNKEKEEEKKE